MNESSRQERIIRTSVVGILVNLLIAAVKIMIGTLASSIAIVSEGLLVTNLCYWRIGCPYTV